MLLQVGCDFSQDHFGFGDRLVYGIAILGFGYFLDHLWYGFRHSFEVGAISSMPHCLPVDEVKNEPFPLVM